MPERYFQGDPAGDLDGIAQRIDIDAPIGRVWELIKRFAGSDRRLDPTPIRGLQVIRQSPSDAVSRVDARRVLDRGAHFYVAVGARLNRLARELDRVGRAWDRRLMDIKRMAETQQ